MGYVWVSKELPLGAPEDALGVGCDDYGGDLLPSLSSTCDGGVEACFNGVVLSDQHSTCRRICYRYDEVRVQRRAVLLGVIENIGSVRGGPESVGGLGVCCMEFPK